MTLPNLAFPQSSYPMVDQNGMLTTPWLQFFIQLYNRTGGSIPDLPSDGSLQALLTASSSDEGAVSRSDDRSLLGFMASEPSPSKREISLPIETVQNGNYLRQAVLLGMALATQGAPGDTARSFATQSITIGASPYSYSAPSNGMVIITGGTVSALEFSRNGTTFFGAGFVSGIIPVRKRDITRITYTVAPVATFVPM